MTQTTPKTNERAHWVAPKYVAEVKFNEWTAGGMLPTESAALCSARAICFRWLALWDRAAAARTFCTAGNSRPIRMAMMAITTSPGGRSLTNRPVFLTTEPSENSTEDIADAVTPCAPITVAAVVTLFVALPEAIAEYIHGRIRLPSHWERIAETAKPIAHCFLLRNALPKK